MTPNTLEKRLRSYREFVIPTPFDHPFTALKSHNIQFGICLGTTLGLVTETESRLEVHDDTLTLRLDSHGVSAITMSLLTMYAIGIDQLDSEPATIGSAQLRQKPHYVITPMLCSYLATRLALAVIRRCR